MRDIKTINLIIFTFEIGGAEKRFIGLWLHLVKKKDINFILYITKELYEECKKTDELKIISEYQDYIFFLSKKSNEYDFMTRFQAPTKSNILHFVMQRPMKRLQQHSIFSITESHLSNVNLNGKIRVLLSCVLSNKIDILDPSICNFLRKIFFYKKNSISLTSNSFVDHEKYTYSEEKKNWVVFLGVFSRIKQIDRFVDSIPAINEKCKENNLKFFVLGYGADEENIFSKLDSYRNKGIDIVYGFKSNPHDILKYAKVIYSLQKNTNYPSKSLLEGISSGCLPITTDVGNSKKIADPSFSYYVKDNFDSREIAEETHKVISLSNEKFSNKSKCGVDFIKKKFNIENMANYYLALYRNSR